MSDQSRTKRPLPLISSSIGNARTTAAPRSWASARSSIDFARRPLPGILNKLCMMLDVRIGDVVSIVSLADAEEIILPR